MSWMNCRRRWMRIAGVTLAGCAMVMPLFAAVDLSSPKSAAKSFYAAMNESDAAAMRDCLIIEGEQQEQLASAFIDVILAGKKLADAARERFGPSGDKLAVGALNREDGSRIDQAELKEEGETATLQLDPKSRPLSFRKMEGGWKLALIDYAGARAETLPDQIQLLKSLSEAMKETTDDLIEGRYPTAADAEAAIQQRYSEAMVRKYKPTTTQPASEK